MDFFHHSAPGLRGFAAFLAAPLACHAAAILSPGDEIIAVNRKTVMPQSSYPAAEPPAAAIDGNRNTKYLNYGGAGSGFIVTPAGGPSVMKSLVIQTANDASSRDPAQYQLWGSNETIASTDNSDGTAEAWTLIAQGDLQLPSARNANGAAVSFANDASYSSYKVIFPRLKAGDPRAGTSMQIGEFVAYAGTAGSGSRLFSPNDSILAIDAAVGSSWHDPGQGAAQLIDQDLRTKYLNYAKENSGFIVTPAAGPSVLESFEITTADDYPERDPTVYELYGTHADLSTANHGSGYEDGSPWSLIAYGKLALPAGRQTATGPVALPGNHPAYTSYMMVFTGLKNTDGNWVNSLQIAEIQFYGTVSP